MQALGPGKKHGFRGFRGLVVFIMGLGFKLEAHLEVVVADECDDEPLARFEAVFMAEVVLERLVSAREPARAREWDPLHHCPRGRLEDVQDDGC